MLGQVTDEREVTSHRRVITAVTDDYSNFRFERIMTNKLNGRENAREFKKWFYTQHMPCRRVIFFLTHSIHCARASEPIIISFNYTIIWILMRYLFSSRCVSQRILNGSLGNKNLHEITNIYIFLARNMHPHSITMHVLMKK